MFLERTFHLFSFKIKVFTNYYCYNYGIDSFPATLFIDAVA